MHCCLLAISLTPQTEKVCQAECDFRRNARLLQLLYVKLMCAPLAPAGGLHAMHVHVVQWVRLEGTSGTTKG